MSKFLSRGPLWVFLISPYSSDASGFYSFVKCVGAVAQIPFRKALILMGHWCGSVSADGGVQG